jgi:hypothetical protein
MHASDDTPLSEFLIDTAIVRGTINGSNDESFVRGRIATFVSVLGMFVIAYVAAASQLLVLLFAVPVLWIGAWLYAERPGFMFSKR